MICALRDQRTKELTLVCNSLGEAGATRGQILAENNQVKKYPLTGKECVSYVVTDLALLRWDDNRFVLEEVAPGYTPQDVLALTEMDVTIAPNVRTRDIYLPPGAWQDHWTQEVFHGNCLIKNYPAPLEKLLFFERAAS